MRSGGAVLGARDARDAAAARLTVDARDLRAGGSWGVAQRLKNAAIFAVASAALLVAERLSERSLRLCGRALGAAAWLVARGARRIAIANITRALPGVDAHAFARQSFRALGERLGEVVASLNPARPLDVLDFLPGSRDVLDAAIAEGRGVVFASAHLGPWERVAASLVAAGIPLTVVAREPYDPRFAPLYERLRGGRGVRAVYRGHDGAGIALVRALRKGGVLAIPMDLATRAPSVPSPFLGIPAPTAIGPARLALRTGAVVIVGAATPEGMFFERIASECTPERRATGEAGRNGRSAHLPERRATGEAGRNGRSAHLPERRATGEAGRNGRSANLPELELTHRINSALSDRIRAWPEAWLWMHHRWD